MLDSSRPRCHRSAVLMLVVVVLSMVTVISSRGAGAASTVPPPLIPTTLVRAGETSTTYLMAWAKCGARYCPRLERTDDDGATFTAVASPPFSLSPVPEIGEGDLMTFVSASVGYAQVPRAKKTLLFETTNGARSWREITAPSTQPFYAFAATSTWLYAITSACASAKTPCRHFDFERAPVSTDRWSGAAVPDDPTFGSPTYENGYYKTIAAYGDTVWIYQEVHDGVQFAISNDDGATFTAVAAPALMESITGCGLEATSTTTVWATCPEGMMHSLQFFTDDGATHWRLLPGNTSRLGNDLVGITVVSSGWGILNSGSQGQPANEFYAVEVPSMRVTQLGHWSCSEPVGTVMTSLQDGLALCARNGFTVVQLDITNNGGRTWNPLSAWRHL